MPTWSEIWNRRSLPNEGTVLDRLIRADGFDSGAGLMTEDAWLKNHELLYDALQLSETDSIFEVGCGAGAFLYPFYCNQNRVGGIDYSASLISIAKSVMHGMYFEVAEAANLSLSEHYDVVVANSVFQYFVNAAYSRTVVKKMLEFSLNHVVILDIPNIELQLASEAKRKESMFDGEYEIKYSSLMHTYYDKQWFMSMAQELKCDVNIFDQESSSYGNSSFRFNVVMTK